MIDRETRTLYPPKRCGAGERLQSGFQSGPLPVRTLKRGSAVTSHLMVYKLLIPKHLYWNQLTLH